MEGRNEPLSDLPIMTYGNMPLEGGYLRFNEVEMNEMVNKEPTIKQFIRQVIGGEEFLDSIKRYTFWISNEDKNEALKFSDIRNRVDNVYKFRKMGGQVAKTLIGRSHQFRYRHEAVTQQMVIPCTSSENREYIPIGVYDKTFISLHSIQTVYDAEPWLFGVLHSKMHMVWVNAVGGKLKTDYRYSAKLCYNTFPFPNLSIKQKETITQYVFAVLDERAKYPEKTMAWLYNPETMPKGLKQAHKDLDEAVERIYRLAPFQSDVERLEYLFKLYEEMTKKDTLFAKEKKVRKKKEEVDGE